MEQISERSRELLYGTWRKQRGWSPINVVSADGVYFFDSSGKRYLDFSSQLVSTNLGHRNGAVIDAIVEQAKKLPYVSPAFTTEVKIRAAEALLKVVPKSIRKFFFSTSGAEANEAAVKLSRMVKSPAYKVLARYRSYHGSTYGAISLTGDYRRWLAEPHTMPGIVRYPEPYCFRCPLKLNYPQCGLACVNYVDYVIKQESNVAAVVVEPITGTNGVIVPPPEYLPTLRKITSENGVLFIADEVMTGWGRTGEWFAVNRWGVEPDILTTAKGASNTYVPLGVTGTSKEVADFFEDHLFAHGHTYEAHPLALATIPAVVAEFERMKLLDHVKRLESYIGKRLNELKESHRSVGDVRGVGFFWALELVKDSRNTPFSDYPQRAIGEPGEVDRLAAKLLEMGVYVYNGPSWLIIAPPLVATEEQLDEGIRAIDNALKYTDDKYSQ
ncbi:aspartate aminotransferase family protein [Sulfodiicoccus acidiphilus]|uniref:Aspartate aminotransferase family protein n=1 Tax=Sulfodiicoccus acidiphilus TaxID=1670455 RepID=A0A348B3E1_9CREN|nr:aspartate aminotransferase family protein [Sulfodiicoccus acidiphilus]BBD72693.1 aspartate aminotransferase family protein [Sulfodiicoccus acidiphilus]GGT95462.1 aspartate aminotransferase family protein [Sulfodiicoccus acidiphilus]